ncbi:hypothetical protein R1flu_027561 [Riccia fluitans]|uniref:H/ACA ribonucleoprotein complex non-core subunit NAF1 n=1 Tax=Riccia fluitans TaxID=41844 RepID=A0ABD1XJW7_9MARC
MGEPMVKDAASNDGIDAFGGERLEPIWSELDFISSGDLRDLFAPPDIGVGKSGSGNAGKVGDGSAGEQLEIGADFWTRKEGRNSERRSKMDGLAKVKEEPTEVLSQQGALVNGNGVKLLPVKDEEVTFGDWRQERDVSAILSVKQEIVSQAGRPREIGTVTFKVKDKSNTELDRCSVENSGESNVRNVDYAAQICNSKSGGFKARSVEDTRIANDRQLPVDPSSECGIEVTGAKEPKYNGYPPDPVEDTSVNNNYHSSKAAVTRTESKNLQSNRDEGIVSVMPSVDKNVKPLAHCFKESGFESVENNASRAGIEEDAVTDEIEEGEVSGLERKNSSISRVEGFAGVTMEETSAVVLPTPQYEVHHDGLGTLLKDGILSTSALGKIGIVDDSSGEEENESSQEEGESEEESGSDDASDDNSSDISSSEEDEEMKTIKEKIRSCDETKEDTEPPRTKNELSVLPPVPKVEAVLEPHHVCISIGVVSSVVDRYIVVEGREDSRVINDGSVLWLSGSRVPLGIVDEVFGPVRKPYYSLRFNETSDIHESAKVGADVGYVQEYAEFVLKDNPNLYKKAIDASGLDDEELSDEEIEFSDDEKEMAAKQKERAKRSYESKEDGASARNSTESHPPESKGRWQRRERGRGRGSNRGGRHMMGVDSAMADMDLHGSGFKVGSTNYDGRPRGRPGAGRTQFQNRDGPLQSSLSSRDRQDLGATYSRLHEGLSSRGDWVPSPTRQSPRAVPSSNGAHHQVPVRRDERRDGPWYSEQTDLAERQPHQAVAGMQGFPSFGGTLLPRHSQGPGAEPRQQVGSSHPAFGYSPIATPQIATDGQGNFFHITGPVSLSPDVGSVGRMGMNVRPTMVSVLPPTSSNCFSMYTSPVQGSLNMRQGGYDPGYQAEVSHRGQHGGFVSPSPGYSSASRMAAPDFRFQAMPSNSPFSGAGGMVGSQGPGYGRGSPPAHRQRFQGPRGR